jgi:CHAT domain
MTPMIFSPTAVAVRTAVLLAAKSGLGQTATVPRPQVHLFADDPCPRYVGCVLPPEFEQGGDAAWAIRGLGYPLSTLPAGRVLAVWENADLLMSLDPLRFEGERALVFLDATVDDHSVTWYPFEVEPGSGLPVDVRWGEPRNMDHLVLPEPISDVLDIWRTFIADGFTDTVSTLEQAGYTYIPADDATGTSPMTETVHLMVGMMVDAAVATGEPAAVERACQALGEELQAMSEGDPRRGLSLVNFSSVLQLSFENSGDLGQVAQAIRAAREAGSYLDEGSSATWLNVLGTALRVWYGQTGDLAALREAITVGRQAVDVTAEDEPYYGGYVTNLAWALHELFMAEGEPEILAAAISAVRRVYGTLEVSDPHRETVGMTLGVLLHSEYGRTGDLAALDEAIELGRSTIADSASSGWMLAARLTNLGRSLEARYWRTGELGLLLEAARMERRALEAAPADHADRTIYRLNLSGTLRALFDRTGDPAVLDEALAVALHAAEEVPAGHPFRINHLANLGLIHQERYHQTADVAELDAAQSVLREALAEASSAHPDRPVVLCMLGAALHLKSRHTAEFGELDEAIGLARTALDSVADDHPRRGTILRTLAEMYQTRHQHLGDRAALSMAIGLFRAAAADPTSSMGGRMAAARRWGEIAAAAGRTGLALDGFATAVELLPLLAARSLHRYDSEYWLGQCGGLASDAAALALEMNAPDRAVELLELGRTVLIAQALEIRTDLSALRDRDPGLADRFEWFSARLEGDDGQPDSRRALAEGLEAVIAAVRALPDMDRFLVPPTAADILAQAGPGPIVMVNISAYRCDALILSEDGVRSRPLPQLTADVVGERVSRFLTAVTGDCRSQFRQARERGERTVAGTLSWLWDGVCAPVLDTVHLTPGDRMWWIPTGLLGFLPLHAASSQASGESMLDRTVCSYAPSVRALAHARAKADGGPSRTVVVAMPHTPDATDLPGAQREATLVAERTPNVHKLIGPDATSAAVTAALQHSAWAHFACHAVTATSPSDSRLLLHDHDQRPLTAAAISRLRLDSAALAYLSACHTAVSTTDLADEVIHIASAFHLAGYPHVIGTLWAVGDCEATTIAELVYDELTSGAPDPRRAPAALRNALVQMRASHPNQPSCWASHVYIGI